jgi:serine/threonine protein kinase
MSLLLQASCCVSDCLLANQATLNDHMFLYFVQFIAILLGHDISDQLHFLFWQLCFVCNQFRLAYTAFCHSRMMTGCLDKHSHWMHYQQQKQTLHAGMCTRLQSPGSCQGAFRGDHAVAHGTLMYMPPELLLHGTVSCAVDVYSLSILREWSESVLVFF